LGRAGNGHRPTLALASREHYAALGLYPAISWSEDHTLDDRPVALSPDLLYLPRRAEPALGVQAIQMALYHDPHVLLESSWEPRARLDALAKGRIHGKGAASDLYLRRISRPPEARSAGFLTQPLGVQAVRKHGHRKQDDRNDEQTPGTSLHLYSSNR
jgi:hypothetical protein